MDDECGFDVLGADEIGDAKASIEYLKTGKGPGPDWSYDDLNTWSLQKAVGNLGFKATLAQLRTEARRLEEEDAKSRSAAQSASQAENARRVNGYEDPKTGRWIYTSAAAAKGCHANGMTIWHFLFFAVLLAAIFFAPRIFAFTKKHGALLLRDGLRAVSAFGRRLRRNVG